MKSFNYKGITLIALIITIIVMLILAGVTIATLTGKNGLLNKSERAAEETQIKGYEEKIKLATTEGNSNALIEPEKYEDEEDILDDIGNIIKKDSQFEEAKIYKIGTGTEDVKLVVVTKEGYVFYVEVDKIKYAGTKEEVGDIVLDTEMQIGDIIYTYNPNPDKWTNGKVEVKIEIAKEEYKQYDIEYSYDVKTWNKYEEGQTLTVINNNTAIYTRLRSDNTVLKGYATGNVTNIDRLEPNELTSIAESTTSSITVTAEVIDQEATEIDGCSGIAGYRFSIDNGTTWTEYQESGTYTWENLSQTTEYTITVETKDNAGNTITGTATKGTGTIEAASGATYTPTTWTNGKVTVTLPTKSGFTTRYTTDGTAPTKTSTEYTSAFTVSSNCTINYIYTDGTNIGTAGTANVTNIDTTAPNSATITLSKTITTDTSITAKITQSDSLSGIDIDQCKWVYNTTSTKIGTNTSSYTGGTFSSNGQTITLSKSTSGTYYLHVLTVDNAGNKYETVSSAVTVHIHTSSCYTAISCSGSFRKTNTTSSQFASCSHSHTSSCYSTETYSCSHEVVNLYVTYNNSYVCAVCGGSSKYDLYQYGFNCDGKNYGTGQVSWLQGKGGGSCGCNGRWGNSNGIRSGTTSHTKTREVLSCGKSEASKTYYRDVSTYTCSGCGKSCTYYSSASYSCSICGSTHSVSSSGSTSTSHYSLGSQLSCSYKNY